MAIERDLGKILMQPLPPEIQAAEDERIRAILDGLPEASGTFTGHLVRNECYGSDGCSPQCPPEIRIEYAADVLGMRDPN